MSINLEGHNTIWEDTVNVSVQDNVTEKGIMEKERIRTLRKGCEPLWLYNVHLHPEQSIMTFNNDYF